MTQERIDELNQKIEELFAEEGGEVMKVAQRIFELMLKIDVSRELSAKVIKAVLLVCEATDLEEERTPTFSMLVEEA